MTLTPETLRNQHIDTEDYDDAQDIASRQPVSLADRLKVAADSYLDDAISNGKVESSVSFVSQGSEGGFTEVETESGVTITRYSSGGLRLKSEYDELIKGADPYDRNDLVVKVDLPVASPPRVTEERWAVEDGERTGEVGERTLGRRQAERIMGQTTKLIFQVF